jgi:hypothetical protein
VLAGKTGNSPGETEKDAGKREAVYPAGKEKTAKERIVRISKTQYPVHSKHLK